MRPMLAAKAEIADVRFPCLVSPKLDGIRAIVKGGVLLSRSLKPIRNAYTQRLFGRPEFEGFDGELIVGEPNGKDVFRETTTGVMSGVGMPNVTFYVFDLWNSTEAYALRRRAACKRIEDYPVRGVTALAHGFIETAVELSKYEESAIRGGFEGVIVRDPSGAYKFGRSTLREGGMLKLKRFSDSEAVIIGFEEAQANMNEAETNELGLTKRSKVSDGLFWKGTLGALVVKDVHTGIEFNVGTGFDDSLRAEFWSDRQFWLGKIVKYKYFNHGIKDKPRHPVFIGMRDVEDMDSEASEGDEE